MQWRMLARRCPSGSMTLVGDFGQSSRPGAATDWDEVLVARSPTHDPGAARSRSRVNYRTPAEIMARRAPRARGRRAGHRADASRSASTGVDPEFASVAPDELRRRRRGARARAAVGEGTGTVAVVAPLDRHDEIVAALADVGAVADTADALDAPIAVLDAVRGQGPRVRPCDRGRAGRARDADAARPAAALRHPHPGHAAPVVVHAEPLPEALAAECRRTPPSPRPSPRHEVMLRMTTTDPTATDAASRRSAGGRRGVGPRAARRRQGRGRRRRAARRGRAARRRAHASTAAGSVSSTPPSWPTLMRELAGDQRAARARRLVRGLALLGRHRRPGTRRAARPRRGARHRDRQRAAVLRAGVGRAARRARRAAARRRRSSRSAAITSRRRAGTARTC